MKQQFFGNKEAPLFGVYHEPRGRHARGKRAVLFCPPIGQEYNRTHWTLRLLAKQLARKGQHVMRMDYSGTGDSAGFMTDVESLSAWHRDIELGIEQLKRDSGVSTVMLLGQRLGASLAASVAIERPDVNALVSWELVIDGRVWLDELRQMHARMLDLWVCKMTTDNDDQREEILGSLFRRELIADIESLHLKPDQIIQPQLIIEQESKQRDLGDLDPSLQKVIHDPRPGNWGELRELETAYLRPRVLQQIVRLTEFMFDRLDRFGALDIDAQVARQTTVPAISIPVSMNRDFANTPVP